jgi:7,8-dihydro-6-hydroxymethylpterin-pyrophosphokinase
MAQPPFPIVIGLGSNLGDQRQIFRQALAWMKRLGI